MSLIDDLMVPANWAAFQARKREQGHLSKEDDAALAAFIETRAYLEVVTRITDGTGFGLPTKKLVNKAGSERKRVVYSFDPNETWILKLVAQLLYRYDDHQPTGCYSFRRDLGAHQAVRDLIRRGVDGSWCTKIDVHDYFNSISVPRLLSRLQQVMADDPTLLSFLTKVLTADQAYYEGAIVNGPRGVMAGTPTAPFLANLYLADLDGHFTRRAAPYARYSDDIVVFAASQLEAEANRDAITDILAAHELSVNERKTRIYPPDEPWEFLGFSYLHGVIDLSTATRMKLKAKIRRKARSLRRWMLRKGATPERAQRALIRSFNRKFFETVRATDLTWCRWFFPLLTTATGLQEIDHYLQGYLRWLPTGRFIDRNYITRYADLKALGYRSLVHEHYAIRHTI
ncbi:MAG: hypothetical protein LBH11_02970 [Propionibacteriaceae bacterium]|jgi:hypothetical protein|nr:hypothetical protein [Propionibacteriaceae bacterium]